MMRSAPVFLDAKVRAVGLKLNSTALLVLGLPSMSTRMLAVWAASAAVGMDFVMRAWSFELSHTPSTSVVHSA